MRKVKGVHGLFFHGINKARNSHEMRKVYNECFLFHVCFAKNTRKMRKCIAGIIEKDQTFEMIFTSFRDNEKFLSLCRIFTNKPCYTMDKTLFGQNIRSLVGISDATGSRLSQLKKSLILVINHEHW